MRFFFSSPTGRKAQYFFSSTFLDSHQDDIFFQCNFRAFISIKTQLSRLSQVIFAFTRTLDVRFESLIGKNDIFRRSLSIEHHFVDQKKYFCGRPGELFFRHPVRRKQTYFFFWPYPPPKVCAPPPFQIVHNKHRMKIP